MPHHVTLWLQYCKDLFLLPKMNETNLISYHSFLLICQIEILWVSLFSSIYPIVTLITLEKHTKGKSHPSASPPPSFLYMLLKEMWMVNCNVCGYLCKLHLVSFFPQKRATFSAALTWLSSTAKGVLQIYPSGGFRPVFSFVLGFLAVSLIFYKKTDFLNFFFFNFSLGQLLIISWYFCYIWDTATLRAITTSSSRICYVVADTLGIWPVASTNTSD